MQFPESWLRTFCNPKLDSTALGNTLTLAGLEVEDARPAAPLCSQVVIALILNAAPHPNAEKLQICTVDVGGSEPLQIVCGAPNARAGIKIPCALVGALLPTDEGKLFKIGKAKLRGVESSGMLCSAKELHISSDSVGIYELPQEAPVGQDIRQYLHLDDTIFTLKLTPNLAHCLSIYGIARELSAITGAPLSKPAIETMTSNCDDKLPIGELLVPDLCGRFSGRIVKNLNCQAKTPAWMIEYLERCGQRSINALVDISNYVMFELGQPSHIFDLDKINGKLTVRWGKKGETLKLLNGNTVEVDESVGVIADQKRLVSLAGIMGGDVTSIDDHTKNIIIEAAFWRPEAIVGRSRKFNFSTDAGHRFERGVDPTQVITCLERITQLVIAICGTKETSIGPIFDSKYVSENNYPVKLRASRASKVIGLDVTLMECQIILERLGMKLSSPTADVLEVTPPSWRFDIRFEEDLIEEIARLTGFDALPHTAPQAVIRPKAQKENQRSVLAVKNLMVDLGYHETINFSFVEEKWEKELSANLEPIALLNPIASHLSVMRSSLLPSLLHILKFNQARRVNRVRIFEVGMVFKKNSSVVEGNLDVPGIHQSWCLSGLAAGSAHPLQWSKEDHPADFFDVKGDLERLFTPKNTIFVAFEHPMLHPGRTAQILCDGKVIGVLGELHPKWRQSYDVLGEAPILFEFELQALTSRTIPAYSPISKFQSVVRDIAVLVGQQVSAQEFLKTIEQTDTKHLLQSVTLFDVYQPKIPTPHEKSMAARLTFSSLHETLTDEIIESLMTGIKTNLKSQLGAIERL